jgi:polyhydroxybutyrate depolymerase
MKPRVLAGAGIMVVACAGAGPAVADTACGGEVPCRVGGGWYHAVPPAGWDGTSPLPATVFFHGWRSTGRAVVESEALVRAFSDEGVLLIAPDGRDKTWAHVGSPSSARDDLAFVDAVMADVRRRWPIDGDRLLVTGFSQGASMAWDVACYRGDAFAAFAPIAGAFWEPLPETCPAGPVNLRHVHGTGDGTVPMAGRPIRDVFRQGDVRQGMAVWRGVNGCPERPSRVEREDALTCEVWDRCASGRELRLCLHDGGHAMPPDWEHRIHEWARSVAGK